MGYFGKLFWKKKEKRPTATAEYVTDSEVIMQRQDSKTEKTNLPESIPTGGTEPKDAEGYRKEGFELERQNKFEEAFGEYEKAAEMGDAQSMVCIARMYLSGNFRPVDSSNLANLLFQGGPVFPWSIQHEKKPDYESGLEWLTKAADLGNGAANEMLGNMLCSGIGCTADIEKGIRYLEKAVVNGRDTARKYICLYRPDGKALTDEEYEVCLAEFTKAADAEDDKAYELYATLKSGTQKQLARLGHILIAAQNVQKNGYEVFKCSTDPSGIPLLPVAAKRWSWRTFLRFNLDAWMEKSPLIAVSADILRIKEPFCLLDCFHHARIIGTAVYKSPAFGWLDEEKEAVLIRLGVDDALSSEGLKEVVASLNLAKQEYAGENLAFMVENGEKEYSLEIAGIKDGKVEVLWRYTIGGSNRVNNYFEPELISMEMDK